MPQSRPLIALLMSGTVLSPVTAAAQETTTLAPIVVDAEAGDGSTVVATDLSMGGKSNLSILDTAGSVSVVTAKEFRDRGVTSTEQALQYSAGVVTDFYGSDNRWDYFKIRGFDAFVYRDGLRLGGSGQSANNLREEVFAYERVEVLKGADTTLFGVSDPGGMVNYVTKVPRAERFGEAYATVGSHSHKEAGVDFGDVLGTDGTLSYRVTAKVQDADAEQDYSRDDKKFVMGGLSWRPTDVTTVSLVVDYLKWEGATSAGLPLGTDLDRELFLGEPDFNRVLNERKSVSLIAEHDFGGGLSFSANTRYDDKTADSALVALSAIVPGTTEVSRYFFATDTKGHTLSTDARLTYKATFGDIDSVTTGGVQYSDNVYSSTTWYDTSAGNIDWTNPVYTGGLELTSANRFNASTRGEETKAVYAQQQLTFSDKLIATIGVRHDWVDIRQTDKLTNAQTEGDYSETTARLGLTYKITPEISVYGTYAESAVPASTLSLEPERGEQIELGVKYQPTNIRALFTASVYDLTKKNITRVENNIEYLVGEVAARGLELEARAEVLDGFDLIAAYSYTDTKIEDGQSGQQGNQLGKVPTHLASLWGNYTLQGANGRGDMTFGLGARYTGSYFNNDGNTGDKSGSAVIYDAAFSYEFAEDTSVSLNATNLFDEKYATGGSAIYYNAGRKISATIRRTW